MRHSAHRWIAYAAAAWASIFAALHFMWAGGWYVGLDPVEAEAAFAVPWMFAYNLLAAVMCAAAAPIALALGSPGAPVPHRLLGAVALLGTTLLVLRAAASLVDVILRAATGRLTWRGFSPWEPWFYLGAALFALDLWWFWRRSATDASSANSRRSTTTRAPMSRISSKK